MNILLTNSYTFNVQKAKLQNKPAQIKPAYSPNFTGKDMLDIFLIPEKMPQKFELTPLETAFHAVLVQFRHAVREAHTLKENLKQFYSAQDKIEYNKVLRQKNSYAAKLKHIATKNGVDEYDIENIIDIKREYNRFAPKILRATTIQELKNIENDIQSSFLFYKTQYLLNMLIEQRKQELL